MHNKQSIKQLIKELDFQKRQAENILSKILLPILITSKKTRKIVYANPYAQKQYETTLEQLVGMEVSEFYTNESQREKILSNLKEDGTVENLEMHWKTHKGNTFYGLLSLTHITFNDEDCFMGMVKDITIQKEQDARLAHQEKMTALTEMMSNVAHQWRQPLNSISLLASGVRLQKQMGIIDDTSLDLDLQEIEKEAKNLSKIIDEFKVMIDDANQHIMASFNLNNTFDTLLSLNKYDFKIDINIEEEINLFGKSSKFIESIEAILQNSNDIFKIRDIKDPFVQIKAIVVDYKIIITILDNAGGIPSNIISKVFEPYFTTEHQSQGKGLGLYNVHNTIEEMQGKIEVENKIFTHNNTQFMGANFIITLPSV